MLRKYSHLAIRSGERIYADPFYFYPLEAEDYIDYLRSYDSDERYPLMAFYYLTHRCWDACQGCFVAKIKSPTAEQPWDVIERTLRDLAAGGTQAVKFAGRESTVSPHLGRALDLSAELGMKTVLITAGANLGAHAESIARSCTHLRVSLNAVRPEVHKALHRPSRRALPYTERVRWVEWILRQRDAPDFTHGATFLVRLETLEDVVPYARLCRDLGFHYVRYAVLDDAERAWPTRWQEIRSQLFDLQSPTFQIWMNTSVQVTHPVPWWTLPPQLLDPAVITRVTIHANGEVNACQEGWRGEWGATGFATFGNVHDMDFRDIWRGAARSQFLEQTRASFSRQSVVSPGCVNCKYHDLIKLLRWVSYHEVVNGERVEVADEEYAYVNIAPAAAPVTAA